MAVNNSDVTITYLKKEQKTEHPLEDLWILGSYNSHLCEYLEGLSYLQKMVRLKRAHSQHRVPHEITMINTLQASLQHRNLIIAQP